MNGVQTSSGGEVQAVGSYQDRLTPCETRLALAVAHGHANKRIAAETGRSLSAIKFALSGIYTKLNVSRYQVGSPRVALAMLVRDQPELFGGRAA